jgi:hypothetical protein
MGYYCFILWVLLSGSLGGLVFSLTTGESHKLRLPARIRDKKKPQPSAPNSKPWFNWPSLNFEVTGIDTGFFGHMIIGAVGGIILFSLTVSHLNFDVSPAIGDLRFHSSRNIGKDGMLVLVHTLSLGVIGGFLGLRVIVKVADEAFKKLGKEVENIKGQLTKSEENTAVQRHIFLARALIQQPDLEGALAEIEKALAIHPTKHSELVKGLILKRKGELRGAVEALDRAFSLEPDVFVKDNGGVHWNKACYLALLDPVSNLDAVISNLDQSLSIRPEFKDDIKGEKDFAALLDNPKFQAHFKLT